MKYYAVLSVVFLTCSCAVIPQNAFVVTNEQLQQRQIETRRYDGIDETALITASANALQDLGYNLDNSEVKLGVITASKQRDATNAAEVTAAVAIILLGGSAPAISKDQTIRVTLVVRPVSDSEGMPLISSHFVRVTFQRVVRRTDNSVFAQTLRDPELFQGFYERVSKSVFIEAQKL